MSAPAVSASFESAPAVEVAALLGDSVVGVTHCLDPRGGAVTRTTWAWLALAAAALAAAAIACGIAVHVAAANDAALAAWTRAHRPAWAFRAHLLGPAYDLAAAGGFVLGVVAAAIGLARLRAERRPSGFAIGTAPGVDLAITGAPSARFPLVAAAGDGFVLHVAPGIDGEVAAGGAVTPLAASPGARPSPRIAGALELPIADGARICARIGGATLVIAGVARPRRHAVPLVTVERRALRYAAGSLVAHLGLLALLAELPPDGGGVGISLVPLESTGTRTSLVQHDEAPASASAAGAGLRASDFHSTEMRLAPARAAATAADSTPAPTREGAIAAARTAGVLGTDLSALQDVVAASDEGLDGLVAVGTIYGGDDDGNGGGFGEGRRLGPGGGGAGWGIIGTGRYGTIASGGAAGDGVAGGIGGGGLVGRHAAVPTVKIEQPTVCCRSDKAIIRRYIRRNLDKIRYCYEHELLARPGIAGDIHATFMIMPDGSVASSRASGFDPTVAGCVAHVISGIEFPKVTDGGPVEVNYPFEFHATP